MAVIRTDPAFAASRLSRRLTSAILFIATALAAQHGREAFSQERGGSAALVVEAVKSCFVATVRVTGVVVPRAEAVVNFNADGYEISEILVAEGDRVTTGQALLRLTPLAANEPPAVAGQNPSAGARPSGGAGAQAPASMSLRAPAAGVITASTAKIGAVGSSIPLPPPFGAEPLFRINVGDALELEGEVPSKHLPSLKRKQTAHVRLDNGHEVLSRVRVVYPEVDRMTQLGKVRLELENNLTVRAGMFATATIDTDHSCGVSIPRSAVQRRTGGTTVQVVRNGLVETRRVRLGFFRESEIEVRDGVALGELVIASAGTSLRDGDPVKTKFADEPPATEAR